MTTDDRIRDETLQYDINREAAKISVLLSIKVDKYEYLTGEEILPTNQRQIIEKANFTYSLLEKAFEKNNKNDWRASKNTNRYHFKSKRNTRDFN